MRPLLALAFCLTLAPAAALAAPDPVPRLNVRQSCRDAQTVSLDGDRHSTEQNRSATYEACMQDETQAHKQLAQNWSKFKPANRRSCVAQGIRPSPSYVEILTCLEMNDETGIPTRPVEPPSVNPDAALGPPPARPAGVPGRRGL